MNKNSFICLLSFLLLLTLESSQAFAEDIRECITDVQKFCSGIPAGEGRLRVCLNQNERKLSTNCRRALKKHDQAEENVVADCFKDSRKLCSNVAPGEGRVRVCLLGNKKKLSYKCKRSLEKAYPTK